MNSQYIAEGGTPITPELATELRQLVFGTAAIPMRVEWTQTPFAFCAAKEDSAYGLTSPRNATRGLLSAVQGFIIKYLLFSRRNNRMNATQDPLLVTADMQKSALLTAMLEILRLIADKGKVVMVLPSPENEIFVPHSVTYFHDSITEKLYVFTLSPNEELEFFIKRHFKNYTEDECPGTLLFLYSAVLTRSLAKVRTDLDTAKTVPLTQTNNEEGSLMIVTLLLTGRATPYIHNGVINVGDENSYAVPQYGILSRCAIGLLIWDSEGQSTVGSAKQPGSRLKTPNYPIWVTSCNGHFGVIFNKNPDLLRNYHAESRFDLHYYSCSGHPILMNIDNRSYNEQTSGMLERQVSSVENTLLSGNQNQDDSQSHNSIGNEGGSRNPSNNMSNNDKEETTLNTPLQRLIHTKWEEAYIRFQVQPSTLSYLFNTSQ